MFPNVLFEPPTRFKVGPPEDFPEGQVDERFKESRGILGHQRGRRALRALIAICTHLGCPPNWLAEQNKFKCPCHGSGYYKNAGQLRGPDAAAPRARRHLDRSRGRPGRHRHGPQKFLYEGGQWEDPASYVQL